MAKWVTDRRLQRYTLKEGYVGCPPRPDEMHPIGSYVLCGAGGDPQNKCKSEVAGTGNLRVDYTETRNTASDAETGIIKPG
eukprot:3568309-Pleurochrysis_carterae.AAC.1